MLRSILAFAWLAVMPAIVSAQIALVNVTPCGAQVFPASTCIIPATGSGHLIVVAWSSSWGSTPTIAGVADSAGNSYVEAGNARSVLSTNDMVDLWYAKNSIAGATQITITPNPVATSGAAVIWEFSGVDPVSPLDQTAVLSSQPATTTPAGAPVTTTAASEVIISVVVPGGSINGIAPGNAFMSDLTFFGAGWGHLITSSAGTYASQWNTSSGSYASSTVSFKAGLVGGGSFNACDLNQDGVVNIVDVQRATNMYLGSLPCAANIAGAGICTPLVVNRVIAAALPGGACVTTAPVTAHFATLNWTASTTPGVTYNVYRSNTSGGPYTKLTASPLSALTYVDSTVVAAQTYYYVTTAVNSSGESVNSNEATAVIPSP